MFIAGCWALHVRRTDVVDRAEHNCEILFGSSEILDTIEDFTWDLWQLDMPQTLLWVVEVYNIIETIIKFMPDVTHCSFPKLQELRQT